MKCFPCPILVQNPKNLWKGRVILWEPPPFLGKNHGSFTGIDLSFVAS